MASLTRRSGPAKRQAARRSVPQRCEFRRSLGQKYLDAASLLWYTVPGGFGSFGCLCLLFCCGVRAPVQTPA